MASAITFIQTPVNYINPLNLSIDEAAGTAETAWEKILRKNKKGETSFENIPPQTPSPSDDNEKQSVVLENINDPVGVSETKEEAVSSESDKTPSEGKEDREIVYVLSSEIKTVTQEIASVSEGGVVENKESSLEFLNSQTVEAKTPQELNAETPAETKPETPDFSALAAGDYVAFIQSKGNFPPKFYTSLRDVLIDMSVLDRPEIISDKLIRIDPAFGVMFEEVLEMQKQPGFLSELIAELDAGTLGQPVQQPVKNLRQAAVHTKRQKHQQRGKHS